MQAAVGRVQLTRLASIVDERRRIAAEYAARLHSIDGVQAPLEPSYAKTNWQSYCVTLAETVDQRRVMQAMLDGGISTRRAVMNAHLEEPYRALGGSRLAQSERAQRSGVILPLAPSMTSEQVSQVCDALAAAIEAVPALLTCATPLTRRIAVTTASPSVEPPSADVAPVSNTYGQILKSSAIIGGSSVVEIAVRIVRSKSIALLLGPAGVGLVGLYSSVLDLTHSIDGMGINSSGVRQIAEAVGSGETNRVARTATVLRRVSIVPWHLWERCFSLSCAVMSRCGRLAAPTTSVPVAFLSIAVLLSAVSRRTGRPHPRHAANWDLARIRSITAVARSCANVWCWSICFVKRRLCPPLSSWPA